MIPSPRWRERLSRRALARMALGLAVGAAGGALAHWLHVPLAWMLGALFLCMAAALAGVPVGVPLWLRANFLVLVGLFLGESFDGVTLEQIARWPVSILGPSSMCRWPAARPICSIALQCVRRC